LPDRAEFQKYVSEQMQKGGYSFIDWGATSNLDDSDWEDVYFLADIQSLPERSYYEKPEVVADLQSLVEKAFESAGVDRAKERAKWVVDFEKEFSQTYPVPAEMRELFNTKTGISRKKLTSQFPHFYLEGFLSGVPKRTHLRDITPKNFVFLEKALQEKSLDVLKSVYLFHALTAFMDDAYPDFFQKSFEFSKKHLGGPNVRPVRQERCTVYLMEKFTKELDAELLPEIFPDFPEAKLVGLVEKVRTSIIQGIQSNDWLSPKSKKAAVKKMRVARLQLVKPRTDAEWDFNPPADYKVDARYANNHLLEINLMNKELKELAQKRDRDRWEMGPLTINAYYSPSDNKFVLPIGILQYPFFDPSLPDSANLGAVGMVVGHELGHGVDDHGARYDFYGRMKQWMPAKDLKEFTRRGQKLVSQFDKTGHNGTLTLGENIGDLVGLTFAYRAAFPADQGTPEEKKNFFLQYARAWCGVIRPKFREMLLKTDPHAQMEARVNEQVKHQAGFQQAFGCKEGDAMYLKPEDRVRIW
jgi:putative endopeptidase